MVDAQEPSANACDEVLADLRGLDLGVAGVHPGLEVLHVVDEGGLVEDKLGAETAIAIVERGDRQAVGRRELLEIHPGVEVEGEAAVDTGRLQRLQVFAELGPGFWRLGLADLGPRVLVPVENGGRGIVRERPHLAGGGGVIVGDTGEIALPVDVDGKILGELDRRIDRAGEHEIDGAGVIDLHDRRLLLGAVGGDRVLLGLVVAALPDADGFVFVLRFVEQLTMLLNDVAEVAGQAVPEFEFRAVGGGGAGGDGRCDGGEKEQSFHRHLREWSRAECPPRSSLAISDDSLFLLL